MLTTLIALAILGLVVFSLWVIPRGDDYKVVGQGNPFDSYYGKDRFNPNPERTPPCEKCVSRGCIGAGECRCPCHRKEGA